MKIETELKYQINNPIAIKRKLSNLGFFCIQKIYQEDYYFSPPHKTFAGTRKYYLRLRRNNQNNPKGVFAYHVVRNNLQTKEWEVQVDNFDTLLAILKFLNFKIDCVVKKDRLIYKKGNIKIMIDKVKKLGSFIEIEYCRKSTQRAQKQLISLIKALQLKEENLISGLGYPDLLMER
jgi:predicted adenylyl cyclase CyaB